MSTAMTDILRKGIDLKKLRLHFRRASSDVPPVSRVSSTDLSSSTLSRRRAATSSEDTSRGSSGFSGAQEVPQQDGPVKRATVPLDLSDDSRQRDVTIPTAQESLVSTNIPPMTPAVDAPLASSVICVTPQTALASAILSTNNVALTSFALVPPSLPQALSLPSVSSMPTPAPGDTVSPPRGENASYLEADASECDGVAGDQRYRREAHVLNEAAHDTELRDLVERVGEAVNKPSNAREAKLSDEKTEDLDIIARAGEAVADGFLSDDVVKTITSGVETFLHDCPVLIKSLEALASVHPAIAVVVVTFKTVYSMWRKLRDKDKRVSSLYFVMSDMLRVLLDLRGLSGSVSGKLRLKELSEATATDIENCANVCDLYNKKSALVKVMMGQVWEVKLSDWITKFNVRKDDLRFAIILYTSQQTDAIRNDVTTINHRLNEFGGILGAMFKAMMPKEEADLARKVDELGGAAFITHNDKVLKELYLASAVSTGKQGSSAAVGLSIMDHFQPLDRDAKSYSAKDRQKAGLQSDGLRELKRELMEGYDVAVKKNMATFEIKFKMFKDELTVIMHEESDRVIKAMNSGPHELIKDELRSLRQRNWRRNVKTRFFVMTLRDNFHDVVARLPCETSPALEAGGDDLATTTDNDEWTSEYVTLSYLQPIMEAFDDDGSGYVTVEEVNRFVSALPIEIEWSLPHWIAYWAIGWQITAAKYCGKILDLFATMFAMRSEVLPENRYWVDYYLHEAWQVGAELTLSFHKPDNVPDGLEAKFQKYVDHEEERIAAKLREFKYDIDALDTVYIIAGPPRSDEKTRVRIEKYVYPLLYLLLKRDINLFDMAKTKVLHDEELWDSADSITWVYEAVRVRVNDLRAVWAQQKLDITTQLKTFANGMFEYYTEPKMLWSEANFRTRKYDGPSGEPIGRHSEPESLLNYKAQSRGYARIARYPKVPEGSNADGSESEERIERNVRLFEGVVGKEVEAGAQVESPLQEVLGQWNGFFYDDNNYPYQNTWMVSFVAQVLDASENTFHAESYWGAIHFTVKGSCSEALNDGDIPVKFAIHFDGGSNFFLGHIKPSGELSGAGGWEGDYTDERLKYIFRRTPPDVMCFRPPPHHLTSDDQTRRRLLWNFAIQAVRAQVRRQCWSWSHFAERRQIRLRQIELDLLTQRYGRVRTGEEQEQHRRGLLAMSSYDANFYRLHLDYQYQTLAKHLGYTCDNCKEPVGPVRSTCLDCQADDVLCWRSIDLCSDYSCLHATFKMEHLEHGHTPEHDILRLRSMTSYRDLPDLNRRAREALSACRASFWVAKFPVQGAAATQELPGTETNPQWVDSGAVTDTDMEDTRGEGAELEQGGVDGEDPLSNNINDKAGAHVGLSESPPSSSSEARPDVAVSTTVTEDETEEQADIEQLVQREDGQDDEIHAEKNQEAFQQVADCLVPALPAVASPVDVGTTCGICLHPLAQPCWFCVDCYHRGIQFYICEDCEKQSLLRCLNYSECKTLYTQQTWYYGEELGDKFMCNKCIVKGVDLPGCIGVPHTWLHPLVRCTPAQKPQEERIATLEDKVNNVHTKVDSLDSKVDTKVDTLSEKVNVLNAKIDDLVDGKIRGIEDRLSRLEEYIVRMESTLSTLLSRLPVPAKEFPNGQHIP